ncbi:MAG: nitrophenyl compound nitroreductase subunit ArsF family protein [Paludibacteraceae bacterium]|nr:nitrophenyl compound nitroreductase subunit ArsF family protein [Paludibacteraceae bacterium]
MKQVFAIGIMLLSLFGCDGQSAQKSTETKTTRQKAAVEVFVFHAAQRCATCKAIDAVVSEVINNDFADDVKSGRVVLRDVDVSKSENKSLVEKYEIYSTSLLLDSGGKVTNLTNDAFQYARSNPERLKRILRTEISKTL